MRYGEHNWTQIGDVVSRVAVVPLGSLEQHGRHLPLLTDSMIGSEIVRRAEERLGDTAVFLPMVWIGVSEHHSRFPGTVTVSSDTYTRMLTEILESLIGSGFRRILLLNSHGGNSRPASGALYEVQMRLRDERDLWLVLGTWFEIAARQIAAIPDLKQKYVTHGSELETSMMLRLRPELVRMDEARGANLELGSAFYDPHSGRSSRVVVRRPFEHITSSGTYGHPEHASAEKGEALFEVAADEIVACVREMAGWHALEPD